MKALTTATQLVRCVTTAAGDIEVVVSYADTANPITSSSSFTWTTDVPTGITTAATTTVVPSPAGSTVRVVKEISAFNNSATVGQVVTFEAFDGTDSALIARATLAPREGLVIDELGIVTHYDQNGAPYPAAGLGAYAGRTVGFIKTGTAPEAAGEWYCTSKDGGFPGAWAPGTPGLNGRVTDGTVAADFGCIPIANAATGANYLTAADIGASLTAQHMLFDVLWVNSGLVVTTTTAQAIVSPAFPARDVNGSTLGEGLMIGLLVTTANTNAAAIANATVNYTNQAGTAGRTATLTAVAGSQIPATPVIGTIIWFNLAAGDTGVRSIQGVTLGTSLVAGAVSLLVARPIATISNSVANLSGVFESNAPGVRLYNGTTLLHCHRATAATAMTYTGSITVQEK